MEERIMTPSSTTAAAVSSHEDSMPRMRTHFIMRSAQLAPACWLTVAVEYFLNAADQVERRIRLGQKIGVVDFERIAAGHQRFKIGTNLAHLFQRFKPRQAGHGHIEKYQLDRVGIFHKDAHGLL